MHNFFSDFKTINKQDWESQLKKDLKDESIDVLSINNEIEEIKFDSYQHQDDFLNSESTEIYNSNNNHWNNCVQIVINEEKASNSKALDVLMKGATGIVFVANKKDINWSAVLNEIQSEYIELIICSNNLNDFHELSKIESIRFHFQYDDLISTIDTTDFEPVVQSLKSQQRQFFVVDGYSIHELGANALQEITFCLAQGHELLVKLMSNGLNIDEASACIGFKVGIGNNYFVETAKINALRSLWSEIIMKYNPEHSCSYNCQITATIGLVNKSLKDPYTNLLRQTTETLAALNAGVQNIIVLPYDSESDKPSELAERMARNIPLILQEECYIDKVSSPLTGSYSLKSIQNELESNSWSSFVALENKGGITSDNNLRELLQTIENKRVERMKRIQNGDDKLIGINSFHNTDTISTNWNDTPSYLGRKFLRIEFELNSVNV